MSDRPKIGLAMIAGASAVPYIEETLAPFGLDVVDYAVVVVGANYDKGMPVYKAAEPITDLVTFVSPDHVDDEGKLKNFAAARTLSFDLLADAGCDYALVVDVEEQWTGVEYIREVVDQMEAGGFPASLFVGTFGDGMRIEQLRLYKLGTGKWKGWCHNFYALNDPEAVCFKTDKIIFHSERATAHARREQNIQIGRDYLEQNGDDPRVLFHLVGDLLGRKDPDKASKILEYANRYIVHVQETHYNHPQEEAEVHYMRAGALLMLKRNPEAVQACMMSLSVMDDPRIWATMAEATALMSIGSMSGEPLLRLTIFCADQALDLGKPRTQYTSNARATIQAACYFKAGALSALGQHKHALGVLDHARLYGANSPVDALHAKVCGALGVLAE